MTKVNSIGFTGTQNGITREQSDCLFLLFNRLSFTEFHHGDCVGADERAHAKIIAHNDVLRKEFKPITVIIHPPDNSSKRAFCQGDVILPEKSYLARNRDIVDASHLLIACPGEMEEQLRSGTWSTVRYARQNNKTIFIIIPNGVLHVEVP